MRSIDLHRNIGYANLENWQSLRWTHLKSTRTGLGFWYVSCSIRSFILHKWYRYRLSDTVCSSWSNSQSSRCQGQMKVMIIEHTSQLELLLTYWVISYIVLCVKTNNFSVSNKIFVINLEWVTVSIMSRELVSITVISFARKSLSISLTVMAVQLFQGVLLQMNACIYPLRLMHRESHTLSILICKYKFEANGKL